MKLSSIVELILYILEFCVCLINGQWNLQLHGESLSCASLYNDSDFSGNALFELKDGISLTDTTIIPQWNQTQSLQVHGGCTLTLCSTRINETNDCYSFTSGWKELPEEWYSESITAHCGCTKQCKCEDVTLRRSECSRIYWLNDCNSCNSFYTTLKPSLTTMRNPLPQLIQTLDAVKSVIVRPGCTLKLINETGKVHSSIEGEIIKEWTQDLNRYQCECDPSSYTPRKLNATATGARRDFPPLVQVPKTSGAINSMLNTEWKNHPGLLASMQSMANRRNPRNAYILLLGLTGSGKSTTINFLFDNATITKVGDITSTTTDIHEYRIPVLNDELGLANSELVIIDTPGMIDTRGLEQDAKYLATLDDFLRKHEELKRSIPNVILVFTKFDDNRFSGYGSNFVKMLRTIDLFKERLVDKKFSNIIFVPTHYMSESKDIVRKPYQRLRALKKVIEEFTLLPKPTIISLAENKPELYGLLSVNGFYALPNGDIYPKNLFDKIQLVTSAGGDPIGESIIRNAFKNFDLYSTNISETVYPNVASSNPKVTTYLGILSSLNRNPSKTQISQRLDDVYKTIPSELKSADGESMLGNLQRIFYLSHMTNFPDLPSTKHELLKFFKNVPKNPLILYLLQNGLNLTIPIFEPSSFLGFSYDLTQDKTLPTIPLNLDKDNDSSNFILSDIGFLMSSLYTCELRTQINTVFNSFASKEEYMKHRLGTIGQNSLIDFPADTFSGHGKPGLNIIDVKSVETLNQLSAVVEYRTFSLAINTGATTTLNQEFIDEIRTLGEFNSNDWNIVQSWKNFFNKYGTHVVDSCYGGGYMEIIVKSSRPNETDDDASDDLFKTRQLLTAGVSKILDFIANLMIGKEGILSTPGIEYTINYKGGNHKYFVNNLSEPEARLKLSGWKESLSTDPVLLEHNEFTIIPLSEFIAKQLGEGQTRKLHAAEKALFNASLVYEPPAKKPDFFFPIDRAQIESTSSSGDFLVMKEFASMFQLMSEQSRQAQERIIALISESRKESERLATVEEQIRREDRSQNVELEKLRLKDSHDKSEKELERERILAQQKADREEREERLRREKNELERTEFAAKQEAEMKRNQELFMFVIENNRLAEESRRKNSIWTKLGDGFVSAIGSAASTLPFLLSG